MLFLIRPTSDVIKQHLLRRHDMAFSYPDVGATAAAPPAGWRINHMRRLLGKGRDVHARAVEALFSWKLLAVAGLETFSQSTRVEPQADVAILSRHFGIWSLDFCRVIYNLQPVAQTSVCAERRVPGNGDIERTGFAYGTLPGHAVRGEELFSIEFHFATEEVWYDIFSFSLPANLFIKFLSPLARATQKRFAQASLAKAVEITLPARPKD